MQRFPERSLATDPYEARERTPYLYPRENVGRGGGIFSEQGNTGENPSFRKQVSADLYDGKSVDINDYVPHFDRVAQWNRWSYEEKGIQLALSLRGSAQQI